MSDQLHVCEAKLKTSPRLLFAIWLCLIIVPMTLLNLAADKILSTSESMIKVAVQNKMLIELTAFRDDLSFTGYLQNRLLKFINQINHGSLDAETVAKELLNEYGIKAGAIFHLSEPGNDFSHYLSPDFSSDNKLISRRILRDYLQALGENKTRLLELNSDSENASAAFKRGQIYLRGFLTAPGKLELTSEKVISAATGKLGAGRLLLAYFPFFLNDPQKSSGCIIIIKENDISLDTIISHAIEKRLDNNFTREVTKTDAGKPGIYKLNKRLIPFHTNIDGSFAIEANTSEDHLNRLISNGTYFPFNQTQTFENLPLLRVTAPKKALRHPLREFFNKFRLPQVVSALILSVILLHISFFGFARNSRITIKLLLAVFSASALPFSAFIAAVAYQHHFDKEFTDAEIKQYLQLNADQINKSVYSHMNNKELHVAALSEQLGQSITNQTDFLKTWMLKNSAAVAQLESETSGNHTLQSHPTYHLDQLEKDAVSLTFNSMREALMPSDGRNSEELLGLVRFKSKGLGLILENVGMLHNAITSNLDRVYAIFPVFRDNNRFVGPTAILLLKFFTHDLLREFLTANPSILENEKRGNYLIQKCFIPISSYNDMPHSSKFMSSPGFDYKSVEMLARQTSLNRSAINFDDDISRNTAIFIHKLNCILIIRATNERKDAPDNAWITLSAAYYLILLATMVLMLGKMLIEPINLLRFAAEKIAGGEYEHQISCPSGDEFEPLTESFNSMTRSLAMKEKLASYVSDSVLKEVSSSKELLLSPGGERLEVCVLFCSLAGLKETVRREIIPQQITKMLGTLIDTADKAARLNSGVMDKLIEDTVMLVFRGSSTHDHIESACNAALQISASFPQPDCPFPAKIGMASGPAVSGKIGSAEGKLDFTVIGNPVNLAARLKAQAHKANGTGIILCPNTIRMLKGKARLKFIERTEIKGRSRTFPLYELLEMRENYQPRI